MNLFPSIKLFSTKIFKLSNLPSGIGGSPPPAGGSPPPAGGSPPPISGGGGIPPPSSSPPPGVVSAPAEGVAPVVLP